MQEVMVVKENIRKYVTGDIIEMILDLNQMDLIHSKWGRS